MAKFGKLYFTLKKGNKSSREYVTSMYKYRARDRKSVEKYAHDNGYKVSNFKYVKDNKK